MTGTDRTPRNGADNHAAAMQQLAGAARRAVDRVTAGARSLEEELRFRAAALGSHAREQEKRARAAAERTARRARTYLRKEPLRGAGIVAGIALVVGAVVGAASLRR